MKTKKTNSLFSKMIINPSCLNYIYCKCIEKQQNKKELLRK